MQKGCQQRNGRLACLKRQFQQTFFFPMHVRYPSVLQFCPAKVWYPCVLLKLGRYEIHLYKCSIYQYGMNPSESSLTQEKKEDGGSTSLVKKKKNLSRPYAKCFPSIQGYLLTFNALESFARFLAIQHVTSSTPLVLKKWIDKVKRDLFQAVCFSSSFIFHRCLSYKSCGRRNFVSIDGLRDALANVSFHCY